jgi:hypothetical protein
MHFYTANILFLENVGVTNLGPPLIGISPSRFKKRLGIIQDPQKREREKRKSEKGREKEKKARIEKQKR